MRLFCFTLSLVIALIGCTTPHLNLNTPLDSRLPNEHELFYTAVAANFGDAKVCEKISKRAVDELPPGMGTPKWSVSFQRPTCYFFAAFKTKDLKLCDSVKEVITIPSNGDTWTSSSQCRETITTVRYLSYEPRPRLDLVGGFMKEVGYRDADFYATEFATVGLNNSIYGFYLTIRDTDLFTTKLGSLPSYDEPYSIEMLRVATDDEILTQIFAVEKSLPGLCAKVSPNSYFEFHNDPQGRVSTRVALRNQCFFAISQNISQPGLCSKILKLEPSAVGMTSETQTDCETQLRAQQVSRRAPRRYSPIYFETMEPLFRLLQRLGYPKPFLTEEKVIASPDNPKVILSEGNGLDWNKFYNFMELKAPPEQKTEFLHRVESMPSYSD